MAYYDEQLEELRRQLAKKAPLQARINDLQLQRDELQVQLRKLEAIKRDEELDVERLEKRSLGNFFYELFGSGKELLEKERQEALDAAEKSDEAYKELFAINEELRKLKAELAEYSQLELRCSALLEEKVQALRNSGTVEGQEILRLDERKAALNSLLKEVNEAISAGQFARNSAEEVLASLGSAENWGKWDLWGGSIVSDIAKHSHLDKAQSTIEQLQSHLRRFRTELADVHIRTDAQAKIEGFLRFADFHLDGLVADWTVLNKIRNSKSDIAQTKSKVDSGLSKLSSMRRETERELEKINNELEELVRNTPY